MSARFRKLEARFPSLSKRTGISLDRLREISSGEDASLDELRAISHVLRIPLDALSRLDESVGKAEARLRSGKDPAHIYSAECRIREVIEFLRRFRSLRSKSFRLKADIGRLGSVEDSALVTREQIFSDSPHSETFQDISGELSRGRLAVIISLRGLTVSGASAVVDGINFIFSSRQYTPRMRFTISHELGHILLGHCDNGIIIDEVIENERRSLDNEERLANAFASCFLLPVDALTPFIHVVRRNLGLESSSISSIELAYISRWFGVSFDVAGLRLEQLGIIERGVTRRLADIISKRHGSPEAYMRSLPIDMNYHDVPAMSKNLRRVLKKSIENGSLSLGRISNIFGYSVGELYEYFK